MYKVDLNSDLGESFGAYTIGLDNEVIAHVSSVNVACGYHAGDPLEMCIRDRSGAAEDRDFSDIGGHWAEQYIRQAAALGLSLIHI